LFFNAHWEGAKMLQDKYNIPMALSLIQWALESEWGNSDLAKENNFGGIKYNGKYHHFESKKAFYFAYSRTMNQECYQKIDRTNLEAWLNAVQWSECRYAKSPKYKAKLKRLIKQYKLDRL
jgi:flagellum-specific peptidoglycan hydrolase FlgJ